VVTAISELHGVELPEIEAAVGPQSFKRGRGYARGDRVVAIDWDPAAATLTGSVVGQGALYSTCAFFAGGRDGALAFDGGECTCPVGYNCKHVAAIAIAATNGRGAGRPAQNARPLARATATRAEPPSWEQPLRALIDAPAGQATGSPLAIELEMHAGGLGGGGAPRLMARLMRPGARGGWVNGSLSWSGLDSWHVRSGEYRPDHLALVTELYAVHRARQGRAMYYHYGADKTLDLSDAGAQLWSLLDRAARLGLALVHTLPGLGEVRIHQHGELVIDVTRAGGDRSAVSALLRVDGRDADDLEPLLFLGSEGHGVVCAERGEVSSVPGPERRRLRLVRLAKPAAPHLQQMVLDAQRLEIPASELHRFADELCPALRSVATVVSSDGSFTPPEISGPALVLRASYGEEHAVELGWEWAYQVGATTRHAPLGVNGGGPGFRDLAAERAILADTVLTGTDLERFGLLDGAGRPADSPAVSLTGLDSMRLTTEGLPQLAERPDVAVEVDGQPADYRDVGESLEIGLSTADIAGESDWFDLGVTISVEGRALPFADVFVALAGGESQCCSTTALISRCSLASCSRCGSSSRRPAGSRNRRPRRCGSAATRPGSGQSLSRWAS
jgi:hypothetical protein